MLMTEKQKCIYIYSGHPIFNPDSVTIFENLSSADSSFLYTSLIENTIEILTGLSSGIEIIYSLDIEDNDNIPLNFFPQNSKIFFATTGNTAYNLDVLDQNYFSLYENNIFIRSNTIGVSQQNINKVFDLLSFEDNTLVIGKSKNNKIPFIGFNKISRKLMLKLFEINFDYEKFLLEAGKSEMYINTLENFQQIENFEDFRNLYFELSEKESESYCSQESHERFTNLFIEYRDLLK